MSTEGAGKVCIVAGSPVIIGLQAAVGTGILLEKGVMWLKEQTEKNYVKTCQKWNALYDAVQMKNQARAEIVKDYMEAQWYTTAAAGLYRPVSAAQVVSLEPQEDLLPVLTELRFSLDDLHQMTQVKVKTEHQQLMARLLTEIEIGRGTLAPTVIAEAEAALREASVSMEQALMDLDNAWKQRSATSQEERQRRAVQFLLHLTANQLAVVEKTLEHPAAPSSQAFVEQKRIIEAQMSEAHQVLEHDSASALSIAEAARTSIQTISAQVSAALFEAWERIRREINTFQGVLTALTTMLDEAVSVKMISRNQTSELGERIENVYAETEQLVIHTPPDIQTRLHLLKERVGMLKQDVFARVEKQQQRYIADTLATTLEELGFQDTRGGEPVSKENGDLIRVVTTTSGQPIGSGRDDKIVSFDIALNGDISYDFSGYVGDTCLREAERIFAALRQKGIFILDAQATKLLPTYATERITPELLEQPQWQPELTQNKVQADLAERLRDVLEKMDYPTIRQSVVGGCIELEAFNGQLGYRVVLTPDGSTSVFKDASHTDISDNEDDPVVAEAQRGNEEAGLDEEKRRPSSTKRRKQQQREY